VTTTIRFLETEQEWNAPRVQAAWRMSMAASTNPSLLFQSPEWFENKCKTKGEEVRVAVVENGARIIAIAPFLLGQQEYYLKFCRMRFRTAQLLGGEGLTQRQETYEPLFKAIFRTFNVDGIHFRLLPMESSCWKAVQSSRAGFVHVHDQLKMYLVNLPPTLDEYLSARFDSSHRRNLKQRVKLLRAEGEQRLWRCSACTAVSECAPLREKGELRLQRISAPEDVPAFLRAGGAVAQASWQAAKADYLIRDTPEWSAHLSDLADHGLLRSYLLWCGPAPCAYVLGFQGGGHYQACFIGYDPSMSKFSPGITMLLLIIEDLIQHDPPGKLNFGEGEDEYKRRFGTEAAEVANVTVLRRSILGGMRATGFGIYRFLRGLRRFKPPAGKAWVGFIKQRQPVQFTGKVQAAKRQGQLPGKPDRREEHLKPEMASTCIGRIQVDAANSTGPTVARKGGPR
jgi:CelD/BcsL family acetyltransferase involved in cellulose biosynthesis